MVQTTSWALLWDSARTTSFPVKHNKTATLVGTPMFSLALGGQISTSTKEACL